MISNTLNRGEVVAITDVDVVMADLGRALDQLTTNRDSPREVRSAFSVFVDLSQKLTSVMRKEFPGEWEGKDFQGWTEITEVFKELRNYEQHEQLLRHNVEETSHLTIPAEDGWPEITLGISGTLRKGDPLATKKPSANVVLMAADRETGRMTNRQIGQVASRTHKYVLSIGAESERGRKIQRLLGKIGTADVHVLAKACYAVLLEYHAFYGRALNKARSETCNRGFQHR